MNSENEIEKYEGGEEKEKKLFRSHDKVIAGVCGGIAKYNGWNANLIRFIWVVLCLVLLGIIGVVIYFILAYKLPLEEGESDGWTKFKATLESDGTSDDTSGDYSDDSDEYDDDETDEEDEEDDSDEYDEENAYKH